MIPWFDWDLRDLDKNAREFLVAVREEAELWREARSEASQVYELPGGITIGLDVSDRDHRQVVRVLRVDYGPIGLFCGEDETAQFVTPLTPRVREFRQIAHESRTAAELGFLAAKWLRSEMVRPVRLETWRRGTWWKKLYRLGDTGRALSWSAEDHDPRSDLGEPDQVVEVRT